jgi:pilus assembly protein Flp/PilA
MKKLSAFLHKFLRREDGPTAVEYAVLLALIVAVCIGAISTLGTNANSAFDEAGEAANPSAS